MHLEPEKKCDVSHQLHLRTIEFSIFRTRKYIMILSPQFLRVEKFGKRKKKGVDAKHLLFLWSE